MRTLFTCASSGESVRNTFRHHNVPWDKTVQCHPSNVDIVRDALDYADQGDDDLAHHLIGTMLKAPRPSVAEQFIDGLGTLYMTDGGIILDDGLD